MTWYGEAGWQTGSGVYEWIIGKPWIEGLYEIQKQLDKDVIEELAKKGNLLRLFRDSSKFLSIISQLKNKSTEFEPMDSYIEDDEVTTIYKNWEIPIVITEEAGLKALAQIVIPYIHYTVLYETGLENIIDFYDSQYNLKQTGFYEIKDDTLYLKVSVFMEKCYDNPELITPNAKILVDFQNPLQIVK